MENPAFFKPPSNLKRNICFYQQLVSRRWTYLTQAVKDKTRRGQEVVNQLIVEEVIKQLIVEKAIIIWRTSSEKRGRKTAVKWRQWSEPWPFSPIIQILLFLLNFTSVESSDQ